MDIDYEKLNDEAKFLYDAAYRQATFDVEEKTRSSVALDHGIDKLDTLLMLAGYGKVVKDEEVKKELAIIINRGLGSVPLFGADTPIHQAREACGTRGFLPKLDEVQRHIDNARDILVSQREARR